MLTLLSERSESNSTDINGPRGSRECDRTFEDIEGPEKDNETSENETNAKSSLENEGLTLKVIIVVHTSIRVMNFSYK